MCDLHKTYPGPKVANDGISLSVEAGELFGIFGPNGAGKTTLVRQLVGLARPDSGSIRIDGVDVVASPRKAKALTSMQPQSPVGIAGLTPRQAVELVGRLRGGERHQVRARAKELFDALELGEWLDNPASTASGGVARLVLFCAAAVVPGRLVILDEPTNDVDPRRRRRLWELVRGLADAGSAVVLVTHSVVEAEHAVDRLAIINAGRVVAQGSPSAVRGEQGWLRLELVMDDPSAVAIPEFLLNPTTAGRRLSGRVGEADLSMALRWAQTLRSNDAAESFSLGPSTLEDAYQRLVPSEEAVA